MPMKSEMYGRASRADVLRQIGILGVGVVGI